MMSPVTDLAPCMVAAALFASVRWLLGAQLCVRALRFCKTVFWEIGISIRGARRRNGGSLCHSLTNAAGSADLRPRVSTATPTIPRTGLHGCHRTRRSSPRRRHCRAVLCSIAQDQGPALVINNPHFSERRTCRTTTATVSPIYSTSSYNYNVLHRTTTPSSS